MIEKRLIFPVVMFVMAGGSFAFGIWQYVYAGQVQASATKRMAYTMTSIERSPLGRGEKTQLYATIMSGLPKAPAFLGIDFSGSFASQDPDDHCTSDGQRAVCQSLKSENTDPATMTAICGVCAPK